MSPTDPLAGYTGDTAYLRSADNEFVFMPGGRLQVDGYFYKRDSDKMPNSSILLRRARVELAGWVSQYFFYYIAGDFALAGASAAAQSWYGATDDYVAVTPFKDNTAIIQVGQFDAPFTLENRTSDKYFDFMERSITVRSFGIPSNKEVGAMVHGLVLDKGLYYSLAVLNGDGQDFKNVDNNYDIMGRAWVAPFALAGMKEFEDIEVGGSVWHGTRKNGLNLASQSTQGGLAFLDTTTFSYQATPPPATPVPTELRQDGSLNAFALELHVPIQHKYGARLEFVGKKQELTAMDVTAPGKPVALANGAATLKGWSMYGEAWWWVVGDDTIIGAPGLQLPPRLKKFQTTPPRDGVMVAARVDHLDEDLEANDGSFTPAILGTRKVTAVDLGVNYWHSRRFRASFNYVANFFGGDSKAIDSLSTGKLGGHKNEHEFLFRLAVAL